MATWEIAFEGGSGEIEAEEASGKLSLDETWAFILGVNGHIALAVPAKRVVAITTVE